MAIDGPLVALSPLDEERFGIRTARAPQVTLADCPAVQEFCRAQAVQLLIVRCPVTDLAAAQAIERAGGRLMDTLVYFARTLTQIPVPSDPGPARIRPIQAGEEDSVRRLAAAGFRDYFGHYHADPRLDRAQCDEAYVSWAVRSCASREIVGEVLVAAGADGLIGFMTFRLNSADEGEAVLSSVLPAAQGQGIYRAFIMRGMAWCQAQGAGRMILSTQINHIAVQKVWTRLGFEPSHAFYTFHQWFTDP